jgi:hypothetical protein
MPQRAYKVFWLKICKNMKIYRSLVMMFDDQLVKDVRELRTWYPSKDEVRGGECYELV